MIQSDDCILISTRGETDKCKNKPFIFLFLTFSDWEPGYAIAGMNNPTFQAQPGNYNVKTVDLTKDPVTTLGGITILPDMTLDELDPPQSAMLILPGGATWDERKNTEAVAKGRRVSRC
jgi:hypothetical protein